MKHYPYTIRNYIGNDFDQIARLFAAAHKLKLPGRDTAPGLTREMLVRPNFSPERDLFIAEGDGHIIGYLETTPELSIGRIILDCWLSPQHRRKGLATEFLALARERARELKIEAVQVNVMESNRTARKALDKLGFQPLRRFLELQIDLSEVTDSNLETTRHCRHLKEGEDVLLTQLQNRAFADTWGYNPNTVDEISYRLQTSYCSHGDVVLTNEDDRVSGYCWTECLPDKGRIYMVGTDPEYRGRGIGKRLVLAGLTHLRNQGKQLAELTVDSENKAACAIYFSLGFKTTASSLWYERGINQAAAE